MRLDELSGNGALKRQLSAQERGRGLSHAYLITGPKGAGKSTLARLLAAAMVCTGPGEKPCGTCPACHKAQKGIHPDIVTIRGEEGKDITIAQARSVRADAYIRPNEAARKVYLFEDAASMDLRTQNVLLKLLEEGPPYAAFLLLCENPGGVLETVRSRCELLSLVPAGGEEPREEDDELAPQADALLDLLTRRDEAGLVRFAVSLEKWDRDTFARFCDRGVARLRDALVNGGEGALPQKALLDAAALLEKLRSDTRFNVGVGHLCGALAAGLADAINQ